MRTCSNKINSLLPTLLGLIAALLVAPGYASTEVKGSVAETQTKASYIVIGDAVEDAVDAVEQVGGNVTSRLMIITAVGADPTSAQVSRLKAMPDVQVFENREVKANGRKNVRSDRNTDRST